MAQTAARLVEHINRVRTDQTIRLEALGHGPTLEQQRQMQALAERHQQLFADLEMSLPQPAAQDRPADYQLALLRRLQRFSPTWRETDIRRLAHAGGLAGIDTQIVAEAQTVASDRTIGSFKRPGFLRAIRRTDAAGQEHTDFYGSPLSWMQNFMSPVQTCVTAFNNTKRR
jgi:hypothetical protein